MIVKNAYYSTQCVEYRNSGGITGRGVGESRLVEVKGLNRQKSEYTIFYLAARRFADLIPVIHIY